MRYQQFGIVKRQSRSGAWRDTKYSWRLMEIAFWVHITFRQIRKAAVHTWQIAAMSQVAIPWDEVARTMCSRSLKYAKDSAFKAMQYNFVINTNVRAIVLWKTFGFEIVGTLPFAFNHPKEGYVDALVMFKTL